MAVLLFHINSCLIDNHYIILVITPEKVVEEPGAIQNGCSYICHVLRYFYLSTNEYIVR